MSDNKDLEMDFTGERFIPEEAETEITLEHMHRYILAAALCDGAVVLDAACGAGYGSAILSANASKVCGVDISDPAVAYAENRFGSDKTSFTQASVTDLPFPDGHFDVVVSFETLEHITQHEEMLAQFARVLKPDGLLIISTPDKPVYNEYLADANEFHVRELTRDEFEALLKSQFKTIEVYGQRVAFGSMILGPDAPQSALRSIRRTGDGRLAQRNAFDGSMYLIALCANRPVPALGTGLYEGGIPQNAMSALMGGIAERDTWVRAAYVRADAADAKAEGLIAATERAPELLLDLTGAVRTLQGQQEKIARYGLNTAIRTLIQPRRRARWHLRLRRLLGDFYWSAKFAGRRPRLWLRYVRTIRLIRSSGLIDADFYWPQKAAAAWPALDDARHHVLVGPELDPNELFSGSAYLRLNPDLAGRMIHPLGHYINSGVWDNRPIEPAWISSSRNQHGPLTVKGLTRPDPEHRTRFEWPLSTPEGREKARIFEYRPDDAILDVGQEGQAFLDRFSLLSEAPQFEAACADLNAVDLSESVIGPGDSARPKASIIIPVYGQLAYSLNCLQSLLSHAARASFEIIVGDDASVDETPQILSQLKGIRYVRHPQNQGFVDNCNASAALARGDFVVFLNNDTRVAPGWLDALIDSFDAFPQAGLVGSKLFYPDGSLQEAGGIFWRDGSAWNYGRDDDPNRPRYCYARQVDYVSGAAIAIPTSLWRDLGGFDEIYRPAYAEDADIAFRIRAKGLQTWMQPQSRAIHYEGKTSGTDLTQGVKAYQVTNVQKLAQRWADVLASFPAPGDKPVLARDRMVQKRVLIIDAMTPTPNEDAGSVTVVTTMRLYQEMGYKVYFVPLHNFMYVRGASEALMSMGVECAYHPYENNLEDYLRRYGALFDIVQAFRVEVAENALDLLRRWSPQAPVIFHNVDMHYLRMERQAAIENDPALRQAAAEMKVRELNLIGAVDCTIVHSPMEEDILKIETPEADVIVFPYMTPVVGTSIGYGERRDVTFLGGYRHDPNVDAAIFLAQEVWPLVRAQLPGARLTFAGAHPPEAVFALAADDIIVTGQVPDLGPYFDEARVFAAGIRYGAGVKGKVATAMSHGVPVVATTIAAEGMYFTPDVDALIADDAADFARRIVEIYRDEALWARLSAAGLAFVEQNNSLAMGRRILAETIAKAQQRLRPRAFAGAEALIEAMNG